MRLSGVLYDAGGPLASVQIKFEAAKTTLNGVIVSAEHIFTTQQDGTYFIELEPGYYTVSWLERGRPVRLGTIVADTDSQMSLPEALEADYTPMQPSYIQGALDQMRGDLEAAQAAASTAAADVSDILTQAVAESADRAEQEANRAQAEADRANTYADNAGYVTRERLRKQATLDLDFASGDYALDDGEKLRTTNAGEVLTVERATPKWVFGPNGKLREVPPNTIARQWNPETGEPEGALIEESRTNLLTWSEDLTNIRWAPTAVTVDANAITAPDGTSGADKIVPTPEFLRHYPRQQTTLSAVSDVVASVYLKSAGYRYVMLLTTGTDSTGNRVTIDLETGEFSEAGSARGFVELLGGGWYRVAMHVPNSSSASVSLQISVHESFTVGFEEFSGDGTSGIYIWGAQLEAASTPSSYIKTEDSPVTRAADNLYRELGEEFNSSHGSIRVEASVTVDSPVITLGDKSIISDDGEMKIYTLDYNTDPNASEVVFGKGVIKYFTYTPQ